MSGFMAQLEKVAKDRWNQQVGVPLLQYVKSGDEKFLKAAKKHNAQSWSLYSFDDVWAKMSPPAELTAGEQRGIYAAGELRIAERVAEHWLLPLYSKRRSGDEEYFNSFVAALGGSKARALAGATAIDKLAEVLERTDGQPSSAGRFLLALSDKELAAAGDKADSVSKALEFLLRHAPDRVPAVGASFLREGSERYRYTSPDCCRLLLAADLKQYEPLVIAALGKEKLDPVRARILRVLADFNPAKHRDAAKAACLKICTVKLRDLSYYDVLESCKWLAKTYGLAVIPELAPILSGNYDGGVVSEFLDELVQEHAEKAAPAAVLAAGHGWHATRRSALTHLIAWPQLKHDDVIEARLAEGLKLKEPQEVVQYIGLIGRWKPERFGEALWQLFEHHSKPVRMAAARSLGKQGDAAVARAVELLAAKKAAVRSTAVALLAAAQTPAAIKALEGRLDAETDEEVRDQMLLALEQAWETQGKKIGRKDIEKRIERAAEKLKQPVAKWLDEKRLPELHYAGKKPEKLSKEAVRYLLYRQSRAKEIRPDVEAKPLLALIDRQTSGDFALFVLQSFFGSKQDAADRWALTVAGLLGDDRCVPLFMQQIRKWVDTNRGKLAEYAAQALALLGSDVALCAVDALSIRYRSKQKNIGKAAGEAFAEAAERLGVTPDELGDRVVPWLGFEPGRPRLIGSGEKQIEARIGLDHKLEFRDLAKGKKVASLPAWAAAETKNEFKDLAATLREVVKGQLVRLENLMVRQFRWPVDRWRELYLQHPLLFPFAVRMIWGVYGDGGKLLKAFRALEDRTLTDEQDETVTLPKSGQIGLVHPLELTPEARQAWATHLADYNIESPVLQIERPVVFPKTEEKAAKMSLQHKGTELNGMTFKGRAERLGWQRGSVVDGGGISSYRKCYLGAGADAILEVDGMYIGMGMEESIKLGRFAFVKSGSVTFGSYLYDEPADDKDPRLIGFGDVPPIVFSETLGDLTKIAGAKEAEEESS